MLKKVLSGLGLGENETQVYEILLEHGPLPASRIGQIMAIPRTTTYGLLKRIIEDGLAVETLSMDGNKVFQATPPDKVASLFKEKIDELTNSTVSSNMIFASALD